MLWHRGATTVHEDEHQPFVSAYAFRAGGSGKEHLLARSGTVEQIHEVPKSDQTADHGIRAMRSRNPMRASHEGMGESDLLEYHQPLQEPEVTCGHGKRANKPGRPIDIRDKSGELLLPSTKSKIQLPSRLGRGFQ